MSVAATKAPSSVVPRPSGFRPKASTLLESPAPPSPGSKIPPHRAPAPSSVDLADADIVETAPATTKSPSTPPPVPAKKSSPPPAPKSIAPKSIAPKASLKQSAVIAKPAPSSKPTPITTAKKRDALDLVREAIGELEYFGTPWQAAGVCAQALAKALGARAVIIHTHDARTTEIRVVAAHGAKADVLLGASALVEDDFVGSTVIANGKPMTMYIDGELPRIAPDRLRAMGASKSLVASPANADGEVVAMLEVIDASETNAQTVERAMAHAAAQLGAFLVAKKKAS